MAWFRDRRQQWITEARDQARAEHQSVLNAAGIVTVHGEAVSETMTSVLGWDHQSFQLPGTLRGLVHPDDVPAFDRGEGEQIIRLLAADGQYREILLRRAGDTEVLVDLSAHTGRLRRATHFAEVVEHSPAGVIVLELADLNEPNSVSMRSANPSARRMLHLEHHSVDGTRVDEVFDATSTRLLSSVLFDVAHTGQSLTAERLTFTEIPDSWIDLRIDRLGDGSLAATLSDVTRFVNAEERLRHRASHDALTGLPNRDLLDERLGLLTSELTAGQFVALVLVDIDGITELNDAHGHQHGDQFLTELGQRLVRNVVGAELVARTGGGEFAVLTRPASTQAETMDRARSVQEALDAPLDVNGHLVEIGFHVGVAVAPSHGEDPRTLMRAAEAALQRARTSTEQVGVFDPSGDAAADRNEGLITRLRRGLADQELELRFQPLIELRTGRVAKVEALLRWQRADGRGHLPTELLELAEQSGLIQPLARWVFGEAARAASSVPASGDPVRVCTNLPLRNLADSELLGFLDLLVTSGELDPTLVEIEIAETDLTDDPVRAQQVIARLSALGMRVVLDGFGTGYTSTKTLESLAVRGIKIDRSFITTLAAVPADVAAVRATVELAHELGLSVGAEGVADGATLDLLAEIGCDYVQGFHISGPVTLDALPARAVELEQALSSWAGTLRSGHAHSESQLRG
jgi:diguanylate cyclase (GGDEF)-like protein